MSDKLKSELPADIKETIERIDEAWRGAWVLISLWSEQRGGDPFNNDNYCRFMDSSKDLAALKCHIVIQQSVLEQTRAERDRMASTMLDLWENNMMVLCDDDLAHFKDWTGR